MFDKMELMLEYEENLTGSLSSVYNTNRILQEGLEKKETTAIWQSSHLDNLRIKRKYDKDDNVYKVEIRNSPNKYYFGDDSINDFDYDTFNDAIDKINSDLPLDIDIRDARVREFEVGVNLFMDKEVSSYQDLLQELPSYSRNRYFDTLYYNSKNVNIKVYDVGKCIVSKNRDSHYRSKPKVNQLSRYNGQNILRFEKTYKGFYENISTNRKITLRELNQKHNWLILLNDLKTDFNKIKKADYVLPTKEVFMKNSTIEDYALLYMLKEYNQQDMLHHIDNMGLTAYRKKRLKDFLHGKWQNNQPQESESLIDELENKFRRKLWKLNPQNQYRGN